MDDDGELYGMMNTMEPRSQFHHYSWAPSQRITHTALIRTYVLTGSPGLDSYDTGTDTDNTNTPRVGFVAFLSLVNLTFFFKSGSCASRDRYYTKYPCLVGTRGTGTQTETRVARCWPRAKVVVDFVVIVVIALRCVAAFERA